MSGLFGSITIKGNRLTEFAKQAVSIGTPIPFGFGKMPCEGNIIFAPMPPKEHVKKKKQGKGGVKSEEYSYTLSYAIAFCEGPIYGYLTIKRNGKVVWTQDPNASVEDKAYAAKWAQKATFYYGTETQLPDSTIESYKGAGNVSAFRGLAYIVVEDDDVTEGGGAVPTYEAIVIASPPDIFVTSLPYYGLEEDSAELSIIPQSGILDTELIETFPQEASQMQVSFAAGELKDQYVRRYTNDAAALSVAPTGGMLKSVIANGEHPDEAFSLSVAPSTGALDEVLITHSDKQTAVEFSITISGGTLQ
jgi:hypothetical protein